MDGTNYLFVPTSKYNSQCIESRSVWSGIEFGTSYDFLNCFVCRPEGKKYEKALEWGVQVVNSIFLADIIHEGTLPVALLPRYTQLNLPDEFDPRMSCKASRILG